MTLRFFAALSLILGLAALLGYLNLMGEGPFATAAMWHMRAMKDRRAAPESFNDYVLEDFAVLPRGWSVAGYGKLERQGVRSTGYVQRIIKALDGDYHVELTPTPRASGGTDTTYLTGEVTAPWRRHSRRWTYDALVAAFRPSHGGVTVWDGGPRRVRLSGWLMYDFQYDWRPSQWSMQFAAPRISGWEIHPVTRIELWDDSLQRFVDYPR